MQLVGLFINTFTMIPSLKLQLVGIFINTVTLIPILNALFMKPELSNPVKDNMDPPYLLTLMDHQLCNILSCSIRLVLTTFQPVSLL